VIKAKAFTARAGQRPVAIVAARNYSICEKVNINANK
jgi:hypothetical protein